MILSDTYGSPIGSLNSSLDETNYSNLCGGSSGGGILSDLRRTTVSRGPIPEDSARNLFQSLFESLVSATPEDRKRAVEMLILAYDLPI